MKKAKIALVVILLSSLLGASSAYKSARTLYPFYAYGTTLSNGLLYTGCVNLKWLSYTSNPDASLIITYSSDYNTAVRDASLCTCRVIPVP